MSEVNQKKPPMNLTEAVAVVEKGLAEKKPLPADTYDKVIATLSSFHADSNAQFHLGETYLNLSPAKMVYSALGCYRRANQTRHDPSLGRIGMIESGMIDGTPKDLINERGALHDMHTAAMQGIRDAAETLIAFGRKLTTEYDDLFLKLKFDKGANVPPPERQKMEERLETLGRLLEEDGALRRERAKRAG